MKAERRRELKGYVWDACEDENLPGILATIAEILISIELHLDDVASACLDVAENTLDEIKAEN